MMKKRVKEKIVFVNIEQNFNVNLWIKRLLRIGNRIQCMNIFNNEHYLVNHEYAVWVTMLRSRCAHMWKLNWKTNSHQWPVILNAIANAHYTVVVSNDDEHEHTIDVFIVVWTNPFLRWSSVAMYARVCVIYNIFRTKNCVWASIQQHLNNNNNNHYVRREEWNERTSWLHNQFRHQLNRTVLLHKRSPTDRYLFEQDFEWIVFCGHLLLVTVQI